MDILNSDILPRPDPPGSSDFVFHCIDTIFDGTEAAALTPTDPPLIKSPSSSSSPKFSSTNTIILPLQPLTIRQLTTMPP